MAPRVYLADVEANVAEIIKELEKTAEAGADITLFPEMCLTGYTCGDLFHQKVTVASAWRGLMRLREVSRSREWRFIVGLPVVCGNAMYNCAALLDCGDLKFVAKTNVPNYNEFYERRWWRPIEPDTEMSLPTPDGDFTIYSPDHALECAGTLIGIEICEDLWVPVPPSCAATRRGATVVFNLSASPDQIGKYDYLLSLLRSQSARCVCGYVYASAGWGESSTDLVFDGKTIIAENGKILAKNPRFAPGQNSVVADIDVWALRRDRVHLGLPAENRLVAGMPQPGSSRKPRAGLLREVEPQPFVPAGQGERGERCREIINLQVAGLARRLDAIGCRRIVVGISGGLDSTLALLVAARTFDRLGLDRRGIIGVTMPGFGTTGRTHSNAVELMRRLGVSQREVSIVPAVRQHFADIGHDEAVHDVTYENSQARERTQLLMDIANQENGIVLGTGDLSELALGWATYNGDQMSMYGVNAGVPKTLVSHLVRWVADEDDDLELRRVLVDIVATPISPELTPADEEGKIKQKTEDLVGPYELHDFFLYYTLRYGFSPRRVMALAREAFRGRYSDQVVLKWMRTFYRRFFQQQFKRSCMPDGPKVGSVCLSPRGDWRMPSDASSRAWLEEVDEMAQALK